MRSEPHFSALRINIHAPRGLNDAPARGMRPDGRDGREERRSHACCIVIHAHYMRSTRTLCTEQTIDAIVAGSSREIDAFNWEAASAAHRHGLEARQTFVCHAATVLHAHIVEGKSAADGTLAVGTNVDAISGATVSSRGVTTGVNAALAVAGAIG